MERKIGEIFEYNGEWYQCVKSNGTCNGCVGKFQPYSFCNGFKECVGKIFKKLEKVGEPYSKYVFPRGNVLVQRYKLHVPCDTNVSNGYWRYHWNEKLVDIEIKQNKEDMEEKYKAENTPLNVLTDKYVNGDICYDDFEKEVKALYSCKEEIKPTLKEFDLEAAKQGKPVCTRDGRKARIICFDRKDIKPIVALVTFINGTSVIEKAFYYFEDGYHISKNDNNIYDLMMLPEKKEGWVNVYKGGLLDTKSYPTKKEAFDKAYTKGYVDTVKVCWEE